MLVKKLDKRTGSAGRNHGSDSDSSSKYHCNDDTGQIRRNSARTKRRPGLSCNFLPQRIIRGTSKIGCHIKRASQTQPCDGRNQQQTALNKRQFSTTQSVLRRRKPVNQDSHKHHIDHGSEAEQLVSCSVPDFPIQRHSCE